MRRLAQLHLAPGPLLDRKAKLRKLSSVASKFFFPFLCARFLFTEYYLLSRLNGAGAANAGTVASGSGSTAGANAKLMDSPASGMSEEAPGSDSSIWSPDGSPGNSDEAHFHAMYDTLSIARTRVVRKPSAGAVGNNNAAEASDSDTKLFRQRKHARSSDCY